MSAWPRPYGLSFPINTNTAAPSSKGHLYADFRNVTSLFSNDGFTVVAWYRPSTPQYQATGKNFFGYAASHDGGNQQQTGPMVKASCAAASLYTAANSGVILGMTFITETNSGTIDSVIALSLSSAFPLGEYACIATVANSLPCITSAASYQHRQVYVNGANYFDGSSVTNKTYNPRSFWLVANHYGYANGALCAAAIITGPISSLDAVFLSRYPATEFAKISSYDVYCWEFTDVRTRYSELTGKNAAGSLDFIRTVSSSGWDRQEGSHFWPEYFVRLHDQSADGQIIVNSANDVNLTPYAAHVSINRNIGNFFNRQSAGVAQVALTNVASGATPWTQSKMRQDGGLSITAFYGGSLHVLFSGYVKDIAVARAPGNQLNATITAYDSIGLFRREYISERYRQNTIINSYFSEVVSGGAKRTYSSITAVGVNVPLIYTKEERSIDEVLNRMASFYNPWQWLGYRVNSTAGSLSLINVLRAEPHSYAISATAADTITEFYGLSARTDTENIVNRMSVNIFPRQSSLSQVTSGAGIELPIQISAQSTLVLFFLHGDAQHNEWDGIPGEVQSTFTNSTHFVFNTKSDNTGSNLSANLTITATSYGVKGMYVLANTHATSFGFLTQFVTQPRVFKTRGEGVITSQSSTSQSSYGLRELNIVDNPWHQKEADTRSFAHYMVDRYKNPIQTIDAAFKKFPNVFYNVGAVVSLVDSLSNTGGKYIITSVDYDIAIERGKEQTLRITGEKHE